MGKSSRPGVHALAAPKYLFANVSCLFRLRALQIWPNGCNNRCASRPPSDACQIGVRVMQGKVKEKWMQLCEQATVEQDSEKLMVLITEINRMLDEKEQRLKRVELAKSAFEQ